MQPTSIPHLVPDLRYSDLAEERALLAALTPRMLENVAALFSVRLSWLIRERGQVHFPEAGSSERSQLAS